MAPNQTAPNQTQAAASCRTPASITGSGKRRRISTVNHFLGCSLPLARTWNFEFTFDPESHIAFFGLQ